ncbi:MAG: C-terminal binding protein [Chloroflexota bacterium]|nr:MAG: C-terminal binding protein [Chloroflexota bacterium]
MPFKVVITAFGPVSNTTHENEGLKPIDTTAFVSKATTEDEYIADVKDADAIITGRFAINERVLSSLTKCKVVSTNGVGVDRIDLDGATRHNIVVTNVPDVFIEEVSVHAFMLLLALAKKTVVLDRLVREGRWREQRSHMSPMPRVVGDTLGLVAFGNIPRLVTEKANGFKMNVIAWDPYQPDDVFRQHGVERVTDLIELFRRSDFVSAHLPLNAGTKGLLNYACFSAMKPTGYFINTGRGPTHNEADLIRALREKKLAGAGLDVMEIEPTLPDNPLHTMENVVLMPHSASVSDWSDVARRKRVGEEIADVLRGRMPRFVVNKDVLKTVSLAELVRA